jgi:pSer/pThr/pTyr-binding forkhead associated (FHA) protein
MRGAVVEEQRAPGPADGSLGDPSPAYVLRGVSGLVFGRTFAIDQPVTVGRLPVCDITLQEATLSRCHVRLSPVAEGMLVQDLGSTNGTYVNGQRVSQWIARVGDELRLDCIRFLIERPLARALPAASSRLAAPH